MRISSSTNARTTISTYLNAAPAGDSVFFFIPKKTKTKTSLLISGVLSTLSYDAVVRQRLGGLNMSEFVMIETPLPRRSAFLESRLFDILSDLALGNRVFAPEWHFLLEHRRSRPWTGQWGLSEAQRMSVRVSFEALCAGWFAVAENELRYILRDCDWPRNTSPAGFSSKGFWRVDKDKSPELRHTVLTLIAFHDLESKIREHGGDRDAGIAAFLNQNHGEGWLLPETLRLADYGLGHDDRAQQHQPVASRLGPRFYDWQLAQTAEESWRECHLHARNLLGPTGYQNLLAEIESDRTGTTPTATPVPPPAPAKPPQQGNLF
jgi:hypothetical protein